MDIKFNLQTIEVNQSVDKFSYKISKEIENIGCGRLKSKNARETGLQNIAQ